MNIRRTGIKDWSCHSFQGQPVNLTVLDTMKNAVFTLALATAVLQVAASPVPVPVAANVCRFDEHPGTTRDAEAATSLSKRQSTWNPPSNLVTPLQEVWDHQIATYNDPLGFRNYGYDQIMANKGYLNFCVRWESSQSVTAAQRAAVEAALQQSVNKWTDKLVGFEGFPYSSVPVKVVGWAASSTSLLQGETSGIDVYTTKDADGAPECDPRCGRFFHQDGNYGSCPGGADRHYGEYLSNVRGDKLVSRSWTSAQVNNWPQNQQTSLCGSQKVSRGVQAGIGAKELAVLISWKISTRIPSISSFTRSAIRLLSTVRSFLVSSPTRLKYIPLRRL